MKIFSVIFIFIWILVLTISAFPTDLENGTHNGLVYDPSDDVTAMKYTDYHPPINRALGDIVDSIPFPSGATIVNGLAWDNGVLWVSDFTSSFIFKVDGNTGTVLDSFPAPGLTGGCGELAFDGTYLWNGNYSTNRIYKIDIGTGAVVDSFPDPVGADEGFTFDGTYLWRGSGDTLLQVDPSTGLGVFGIPGPGTYCDGLAWDGSTLWFNSNTGVVYQIDPTNGAILQSFPEPTPGASENGLAFDGQYLRYDDSVPLQIYSIDIGFVALNPPRNLIPFSGDGQVDLWWQAPESNNDTTVLAYHDGTFELQLGCSGVGVCELAVRFTPPSYPVKLLGFEFSQQNASTSPVDMKVYLDPAGNALGPVPPAVMTYPGLGGSDGFYDLDISTDNIMVTSGDFYLGALEANGFMGLAMDSTNQNNNLDRNWASVDGGATFDSLIVAVGGDPTLYGNLHITAIVLTSSGIKKLYGNVADFVADHEIIMDPVDWSTFHQNSKNASREYCISKTDRFSAGNVVTSAKTNTERKFSHFTEKTSKIEGLDSYNVYRSMDGNSFSNIGSTTDMHYTDNTVVNGNTYWYYVTAVYTEGESSPSDTVKATPNVAPPPGTLFGSVSRTGELITIDPGTGVGSLVGSSFLGITEIEFREDGLLYGSTGGGTGNLITINVFTGEATLVGYHDFGAINGLEFSPGGTLYGTFIPGPGSPSQLVIVDQYNASLTPIGLTGFNNIGGLAFAPDGSTLYGVTSGPDSVGNLVTIDTLTGMATLVGPVGFDRLGSLEFGPNGTLYAGVGASVHDSGSVITINPATGVGTLVGSTGFPSISGLSFYPGPVVSIDDGITGKIPQNFELAQNFPNPFNPATSIKYQLPAATKVNIIVYNLLGQKVRTLVNEFKQPGEYQVEWDGLNDSGIQVATGVYLYQIQTGDFLKSRKMILLK